MKRALVSLIVILSLSCPLFALTRADIRLQVRYDVRDTTDTVNINTRFTDAILNDRINITQDYIVAYTKCLYGRTVSTPTAEVQEYALPANCNAIDRVAFISTSGSTTTYRRLTGLPISSLDNKYPTWESAISGLPREYYIRGKYIGYYPKPSSTYAQDGAIKIDYFKKADEMDDDADEPFDADPTLRQFDELVIMGAVIMCRRTTGEDYTTLKAEYLAQLAEMKEYCKFRFTNDVSAGTISINR